MKNFLITFLFFTAGLASAQTTDNWMSSGSPVTNSTGLCWRNSSWTPATAHKDCDGAIKPAMVAEVKKPAQVDVTAPAAVIAARVAPIVPEAHKTAISADALFDFDKSVLTPQGKSLLNSLVNQIRSIELEVIVAVGHTDSIGTDAYNTKLGLRRAQAVKGYLVSMGIESKKIYIESRGEKQPVADNKTAAGRAKNRRVEIELIGKIIQ